MDDGLTKQQRWALKNQDRVRAYHRKYWRAYYADPTRRRRIASNKAAWCRRNPEKVRANARAYYWRNREQINARKRARRQKEAS